MYFLITSLISISVVIYPYLHNKYKNIPINTRQAIINKLEGTICWALAITLFGLAFIGGFFIFLIFKGAYNF
jgi:hypothetical protein